MLTLTITFYDVVLTVHILAVVVAFGVIFAFPVIDAQAKSSGDLAALHRLHATLGRQVITPAMTVVLLAGLYLTFDRWDFGEPWISATLAILFVLFALGGAVLAPTDARLAEMAERGDTTSADYEREARKARLFGAVVIVLVILAIFLMVAKPGL